MKKIRALLKKFIQVVGLMPAFLLFRKYLYNISKFVFLLPLQILNYLMQIYIDLCWFINSNFKEPRDFISKILGNMKYKFPHKLSNDEFFTFYTPNSICQFRAESFWTKEPETLEWLDQYGGGGHLFDIGANVGIYSIYYAKTQNAKVTAFEPSVFNLPTLVKNISENKLEDMIDVVVNPLTNYCGLADFKLPSTDEGGALNGFGVDYTHDGGKLKSNISYSTLGVSLDHLYGLGIFKEFPRLIKIDVDGIEHLILEGARKVLSDPQCVSVLIEINSNFKLQAQKVENILTECGFKFKYKKRASIFDENGLNEGTYNHIWSKID